MQDFETAELIDYQEKIDKKETQNSKNSIKQDLFNRKENDDMLNSSNSKEKNIITLGLSNNEKIVYSNLGINPLIKLGKEYLTSNNVFLLKDKEDKEDKEITTILKSDQKSQRKVSITKEDKKIPISISEGENSIISDTESNNKNELPQSNFINDEKEVTEKEKDIEIIEDIKNSRKKRRRSSASIE